MNRSISTVSLRNMMLSCVVLASVLLRVWLFSAYANSGDASFVVVDGENTATITVVDGRGSLGFGSFYIDNITSSPVTLTINRNFDNISDFTKSDDLRVEENPSPSMFYEVLVAKNSTLTINIGDGTLTAADSGLAINNGRQVGSLSFDTIYDAASTVEGCEDFACVPSANKIEAGTGENTLQTGTGDRVFVLVGGTLTLPANSASRLQYGAYTGTFSVDISY